MELSHLDLKIPLLLNHTVTRIYGAIRVEGVEAAPVDQNRNPLREKSFKIDCDTLVLSVGLIPENELSVMAGIELHPPTGGPVTDSFCRTSVPGIFACGNVLHVHDLVDDVSTEVSVVQGCKVKVEIEDGLKTTGQSCPRGAVYAGDEVTAPKRVLTAVVAVEDRGTIFLTPGATLPKSIPILEA